MTKELIVIDIGGRASRSRLGGSLDDKHFVLCVVTTELSS